MKRSKHSLSHWRLTTFNQGRLLPIGCMEVLPGDSFRQSTSALIRVSPLVAPVMHPVHVAIHHWFVPNRLVWSNWESFITDTSGSLTIPTIDAAGAEGMALSFGIGVQTGVSLPVNALPFRAYNMIWNEFYRDQQLSAPLVENTTDTDVASNYTLQNVSWEKDYFTLCRPYPQQGANSQVAVLTGTAPVLGIGVQGNPPAGTPSVKQADGTTKTYTNPYQATSTTMFVENSPGVSGGPGYPPATFPAVRANLTGTAVSMDINEWRRAMAYQRISEHRNRYGSRYTDYLAFLGIRASDARLQRPEYLGGGKQTISFSEVLSTADTTTKKIGDFGGHGIAAVRSRTYKRFFEEHGWILSFIFVRPKTVYLNQVPRKFLRRTWSDFWQKELEMMGEQAVQNVEVYGGSATPNTIFGYMQRHDDYRRHESFVSGEFRTTLDYWHMARKFSSQPVLNASFISCDPTNRIYASANTDQLYAMIAHRISARRLVRKVASNG